MALKTDDCDIREVYMQTMHGGNGDYYINLYEYPKEGSFCKESVSISYRMAMSGGETFNFPKVRNAFVELFIAMEEAGLNSFPHR